MVSEEEFRYLSSKRIEINSIKTQVGTEAFQKWIIHKLHQFFPSRDYNRAIEIPSKELGARHEAIFATIDARVESIISTSTESEEIKHELSNASGSIDVKEKVQEIKARLRKVLADNPHYEDFTSKLGELVESHPFFKNKT